MLRLQSSSRGGSGSRPEGSPPGEREEATGRVEGVAARFQQSGAGSRRKGAKMSLFPSEVHQSQVRRFEQAGWEFCAADAPLPDDQVQLPVFLQEGGRLALLAPSLVVQFPDDVSEDIANERLACFHVQVSRPLRFAPGLFQARLVAGGDALAVADAMRASGEFLSVEPEWLEITGSR